MTPLPVIILFDIGKTNKKILLFDQDYQSVYEEETTIPMIKDEDGYPCDDLQALVKWIVTTTDRILSDPAFSVKAINFSTFGASFVHIDETGRPLTPLYNYLKPIEKEICDAFYQQFGEKELFSLQTGSPALDMLNSGLQLYWLKYRQPAVFEKVRSSLHLPQYLAYLFSGKRQADITSVGCHTGLWDVYQKKYHDWIDWENLHTILPPAEAYATCNRITYKGHEMIAGIGMHDSSASLLPLTLLANEPSAILSTGTWNITMLPFFKGQLKEDDYRQDCLYYLLDSNQRVAASRIFLGNELDFQLKKLNAWFHKQEDYHLQLSPDEEMIRGMLGKNGDKITFIPETMTGSGPFPLLKGVGVDLSAFNSFEQAYHQLIVDHAWLQKASMDLLIDKSGVKKIYVTGGFARNRVFMSALQYFYPSIKFYRASVNNGSALGAALAMHEHWNDRELPKNLVQLY